MIINMYDTQNIWNINGKINRLKYVNFEYIKNNYLDNIFKYCIENLYFYIDNNLEKVFAKKLELYMFHKFKDLSSYNIKNTIEFICNRIFKFDILQKYIDNVEISRIRIVKYDKIFVKKGDKWQAIKEKFNNEDEIKYLINSILIRNNIKNNGNLSSILLEDKKYNLNFCYDLDKKVVDIKISRETKYNLKELYNKNKILDDISYKVLLTVINENSNILIIGQNDTTINMILIAIIEYLKNKNSFVVDSKNRNIFLDNLVRIDIKKENIDLLQDNIIIKKIDDVEILKYLNYFIEKNIRLILTKKVDNTSDYINKLYKNYIKTNTCIIIINDFKVVNILTIKYNEMLYENEVKKLY